MLYRAVSQTAPEHVMNCEAMRELEEISAASRWVVYENATSRSVSS